MNARLIRRNRTPDDVGLKSSGGMLDLFDNTIKEIFRVNDDEYDYLCDNMTDDELGLLIKDEFTYQEKRQLITIMDKYLSEYEQQH